MTAYQESLRQRVLRTPIADPPPSWGRLAVFPVGGLLEVGFGRDERFLLVASHDGRGVFDCERLAKVARDYSGDALSWSDSYRLECRGIGPLEDEVVRMAGLYGGGLARTTADGWVIQCLQLPWPEEQILVQPPGGSICQADTEIYRLHPPVTEVRALGFSPNGATLVLATASDLTIYRRN